MSGHPHLRDPKNEIVGLRARAQSLSSELTVQSMRSRQPQGRTLVDLGISALIPHGYKGTSRRFVDGYGRVAKDQAAQQAQGRVDALIQEARMWASRVSVVSPSLSPEGNSNTVLRRLGASLEQGGPTVRVARLVRALSAFEAMRLLYNDEIPRYIEQKDLSRGRLRLSVREPELKALLNTLPQAVNASHLEAQVRALAVAPSVTEPLLGAVARLGDPSPDSYRQGLNSLRVALDALIEVLGGPGDWKVVGKRLVSNEEQWKTVSSLHHLLSRGSHSGSKHDRAELLLALQLFTAIAPHLAQGQETGAAR